MLAAKSDWSQKALAGPSNHPLSFEGPLEGSLSVRVPDRPGGDGDCRPKAPMLPCPPTRRGADLSRRRARLSSLWSWCPPHRWTTGTSRPLS